MGTKDYIFKTYHKSTRFSSKTLRHMQNNGALDLYDIVSLAFLMSGNNQIRETYQFLLKLTSVSAENVNLYDLFRLFQNWERKLIEGLVLIDNKRALLSLNIKAQDVAHNVSPISYISQAKVVLYKMFEKLDRRETSDFIRKFVDLGAPVPPKTMTLMELCFMFWHNEEFIDINETDQLELVAKALRSLGKPDLAANVDCFNQRTSIFHDLEVGTYPIKNKDNVGLCVIFNQVKYGGVKTDRESSIRDVEKLVGALGPLNFVVDVQENVQASVFCDRVKRSVEVNFVRETHSIFMLIVMAHGEEGRIFCPRSSEDGTEQMGTVSVDAIQNCLFECSQLEFCPKILLLNACRGPKGFCNKPYFQGEYTADVMLHTPRRKQLLQSDILTIYTTLPQYISVRDSKKGALFMTALCNLLDKQPDMELCEMLTLINARLMQPTESLSTAFEVGRKGHSVGLANPIDFTSRLSRKLYLKMPLT